MGFYGSRPHPHIRGRTAAQQTPEPRGDGTRSRSRSAGQALPSAAPAPSSISRPPKRRPRLHLSPGPPLSYWAVPSGHFVPQPCPLSSSLVLQHDVRPPHHGGRHPQHPQAFIVLWVPAQAVVTPLLQGEPGCQAPAPAESAPPQQRQGGRGGRQAAPRALGPQGGGPDPG